MRSVLYALPLMLAASILFQPAAGRAEPIEQIRVGANYYISGLFMDAPAEVLEVDKSRNRVKVFNKKDNEVVWVHPSRVLNTSDSVDRDIQRLGAGLKILDALLSDREEPWAPGKDHPNHPNVVAAATKGKWQPAAGYEWVDSSKSWAVRWRPGKVFSAEYPNTVADTTPGKWKPAPGYKLVSRKPWRVVWDPGQVHSAAHPNTIADSKPGKWKPAPGYRLVSSDPWRVAWQPGRVHSGRHPNTIAGTKPGTWRPAPGYKLVSEKPWQVAWAPGQVHSERYPHTIADTTPGTWTAAPGYRLKSSRAPQATWEPGQPHPANADFVAGPVADEFVAKVQWFAYHTERDERAGRTLLETYGAPGVSDSLFQPDEVNYVFNTKTGEAFLFHAKEIDYKAISHFEYNFKKNWFMTVMKDGRRLAAGPPLSWRVRPYWVNLQKLAVVRTENGEQKEVAAFDVVRFGGKHAAAPPPSDYLVGIHLLEHPAVSAEGQNFDGAVEVVEIVEGSAAAESDLAKGDVIVMINDIPVSEPQDFIDVVREKGADPLRITYVRDGGINREAILARTVTR